MHPEQFDKIRDYLVTNGQQELVGHLDGFKQEYDKLVASQPALKADFDKAEPDTTPLTEGKTPPPSGFPTSAQKFQDDAKDKSA